MRVIEPATNDLLVFHTVFGKSVPDVSLNAVACMSARSASARSRSQVRSSS